MGEGGGSGWHRHKMVKNCSISCCFCLPHRKEVSGIWSLLSILVKIQK
jgi:hypothetical protein